MSITATFNLDDPSKFQLQNTVMSANSVKLIRDALSATKTKTSLFSSPVGYGFDPAIVEIADGVARIKDQRPPNATFYASFASSLNGRWGSGSFPYTGTPFGGAAISGGKLDLRGGTIKFVDHVGGANSPLVRTGCIRFLFTPNYNIAPASLQVIETLCAGNNDLRNLVQISHAANGSLNFFIWGQDGSNQNRSAGAFWNPVAGQEYEFELNFDVGDELAPANGNYRLFIDGVLHSSLLEAAPITRSSSIGLIRTGSHGATGGTYSADFQVRQLQLFDAVQHTAGYVAPSPAPSDSAFPANQGYVDLIAEAINDPDGIGSIDNIEFDFFGDFDDDTFFAVSLDEGATFKWWNGSAWAVSDGTRAQANDVVTFLANINSLDLSAGKFLLRAHLICLFGGRVASLDNVVVSYRTLQYRTAVGFVVPLLVLDVQLLLDVAADLVTPAGSSAGIVLEIDGALKWWNGTAWALSNGTVAQSNSVAQIVAHLGSLNLGKNSGIRIKVLMQSADGSATPTLNSLAATYDFGGLETPVPTCLVFGYLKDSFGKPVSGAEVRFAQIKNRKKEYREASANILLDLAEPVMTDVNGYFETDLIRSSAYEGSAGLYAVSISKGDAALNRQGNAQLVLTVPDAQMKDITDLLTAL